MYTELCFYVQKVLFFYGFERVISTNRTIGVFTNIIGSLMKKSARELLYISEKRLERNKNDRKVSKIRLKYS